VVVVGASLAGLRAAEALRREGFTGRLVLVGAEPHLPYDRPPLSKQVLAGTWPEERAGLADAEVLAGLGAEVRLGVPAVALDPDGPGVTLADGTAVSADGVVVATGARPRTLPAMPENPAVGVLRTLDDARRLRQSLAAAGPGAKVVVVGAGFIGAEVAATCATAEAFGGVHVTVVEALPTPLAPAVGETVGAALAALHAAHGVALLTGTGVAALHPPGGPGCGRAGRVELHDGTSLPADVVVVGVGVTPNTEWLEGSGLQVQNGLVCDEALFAADRVVAAGDLCRWRWPRAVGEETVRIEHWQLAAEEGVAAARALVAGRDAAIPFDPVPYFWSDQYGKRIQTLGRPHPDDEVEVVLGDLGPERFLALYSRQGRLTAALALTMPRPLMLLRPLLEAGASLAEAREKVAG
jgi:3-phenylpropionate/trans-cinnamate dioxygenase ferredoxin reductase subunit